MTERITIVGNIQRPGQRTEDVRIAGIETDPRWFYVVKQTDETRISDTTLTDDAELSIAVQANKTYIIESEIFFSTDGAADFKFSFSGPTSPTIARLRGWNAAVGQVSSGWVANAFGFTAKVLLSSSSGDGGYVTAVIFLSNGANAGVVNFQWAQNTSDASNTIVRAGSYIKRMTV